ncbi:class E sortase [Actinophytocola sp.]|uniref:sortase n=1 Tax=Actinophytocola sp. TaxID=1872138 RepID=UPI002D256FA0|nr:class E sortase [Actinophytocola sp.]HYQ66875.1 class E sortase [Actinophytocola sp.]
MTATEAPPKEETRAEVPSPQPPTPVATAPFGARLVTRVLTLVAVGVLGFAGYLVVLTPIEQDANQDVLYSRLRGPIAEAVPPYAGATVSADGNIERQVPPIYDDGEDAVIPAGAPIALLTIPRLGVNEVVVEGTSSGDLESGPGHRRDTVLPGQKGVSLVYGRSMTYGGPFEHLAELHEGDTVRVVTFQGTFTYRVEGVRRDGDPLPDITPVTKGGSRLTMVTAEGANPFQPDHTVFVDALLRGRAQPAATHPGIIPPEERSLAVDRPALLNLVLWLQALVLVVLAFAWSRAHWGRWETHLVGLPVVFAVLWYVYESAGRLLPNLT